MNLVDANVLLYAVNEDDPEHDRARTCLDTMLNGTETVGFAMVVLLAFLRLTTRDGLFPDPLAPEQAMSIVRTWTDRPPSIIVAPTARHLDVLAGLLVETGTAGNLVTDAHLAALAIEHGAAVVSYDRGFARFSGVRTLHPRDSFA